MKKILLIILASMSLVSCRQSEQSLTSSPQSELTLATIDWEQAGPDAKLHQISFSDVEEAVADGAKFYDVRTDEEFSSGHFGITENLPLADIKAGHFPEVSKATPIYVHCEQGNWSAQATKLLKEAGYTEVYDLGGLRHVEAIGGVLKK